VFFKGSRYEKVPEGTFTDAGGRTIPYKLTRFIPDTPAITGHRVVAGERLDHIAARALGDPELFWRLCDANRALAPAELETAGRRLAIALPDGVPGIPNA
jgi:hypothetical protein